MRATMRPDILLQSLEKAVHTGNITAVVPEDLEIEAHNTLWDESSPVELTLLKLLPDVPARQIAHEYSKITSYGNNKGNGHFGERSLPGETNFASSRVIVNIKLMGEIGPTFLLAALEKTQQALGTSGAENIEAVAIHRNVLWKKNRNLYFDDDTTTRSGLRFQGIAQQIREGTDGTVGTASPYGTHAIDMQGEPLTIEAIRERMSRVITLFGTTSCLLMDPFARQDLEASMDAAHRLDMPQPIRPLILGQMVAGIQSQGGVTYFETDNVLSTIYSRPQYTATLEDGAPGGMCTVTATAQADNATTDTVTSRWLAADAGNVFYVVTEMVEEKEGLGRSTGAAWTAVAADEEVDLLITPSSPEVESFKVYRGDENDDADRTDPTTAWFIFEVDCPTPGAAVHAFDNNVYRPNTTWAFGLNIQSRSSQALHGSLANGYASAYEHVRANSTQYLQNNDTARNTVAVASLGPKMGILNLASILAEVKRPLVYSACAPEVRNPYQNFYFYNIGRR